MMDRIREHLGQERNVFAYFKHEETPEGALYAEEILKEIINHGGYRGHGGKFPKTLCPLCPPWLHPSGTSSTSDNAHTHAVPSSTDARVVSGFLDYLKIEKGLAPLTVAAYTTDIGQFAGFLEKRKRTLLNAQRNYVREFIQQLFGNSVDGRSWAQAFRPCAIFIAICCSTRWWTMIPR